KLGYDTKQSNVNKGFIPDHQSESGQYDNPYGGVGQRAGASGLATSTRHFRVWRIFRVGGK
ncbi:MAG: hypothetical protein ACK53L_18295, partial [Pirellulaceae bacterium]